MAIRPGLGTPDHHNPVVKLRSLDGAESRSHCRQLNQVVGPVAPEPALEQVRAPAGCLDRVANLVRQRRLRHLARMIRLLGCPVPETRPEAVRHGCDPQRPEQFQHGHIPDWPTAHLRKNERTAAKALKKHTLTNLYNSRPQWLADAHDDLDAAVASAYGWPGGFTDDDALRKLLALNGAG